MKSRNGCLASGMVEALAVRNGTGRFAGLPKAKVNHMSMRATHHAKPIEPLFHNKQPALLRTRSVTSNHQRFQTAGGGRWDARSCKRDARTCTSIEAQLKTYGLSLESLAPANQHIVKLQGAIKTEMARHPAARGCNKMYSGTCTHGH